MKPIEELSVILELEVDELKSDMDRAEHMFKNFASSLANIAAAVGISFGFERVISDIKRLGIAFDSSMREVWTLTKMSQEEFENLKKEIIDLSTKGPYSVEELSKALYQTISAGVDASKAIDFLKAAMESAQAGATDLFTAVDGLTTSLNAWGKSVEEVSNVSDAFFTAVKEGKTTFAELANYIGNVAPTAAQAKVSLEEILAAIAALTKQGISTAQAVTSINYAIQAIIAPSEEAKKTAQELGISFDAATLKAKGLAGFLEYVAEATKGDKEALSNLFGSVEALRGVFALTGSAAKDFSQILGEMQNSAGATKEAAEKMGESIEVKLKKLENQFNAIKLASFEAMRPIVDWFITVAEKTAAWLKNMSPLEKAVLGLGVALASLIPLLKATALAIGIIKGLSGDLGSILVGVGAAVATITAAFGIFSQQLQESSDESEKLSEKLNKIASAQVDKLVSDFLNLESNIKSSANTTDDLVENVKKLAQIVADYNYAQKTGIGNVEKLKKELENVLKVHPELSGAISEIGDKYELNFNTVKKILEVRIEQLQTEREHLALQYKQIANQKAQLELAIQAQQKRKEELEEAKQIIQKSDEIVRNYINALNAYDKEKQSKFVSEATVKKLQEAAKELKKFADVYEKLTGKKFVLYERFKAGNLTPPRLVEWLNSFQEFWKHSEDYIRAIDSEVKEIDSSISSAQDSINKVNNVLKNHKDKIQQINAEIENLKKKAKSLKLELPPPKYEEKLKAIDASIKEYEEKLIELERQNKKESDEFNTDLEILKRYVSQKKSILESAIRNLLNSDELNENTKKQIAELVKQSQELDKLLDRFSQKKATKPEDHFSQAIKEINKGIEGFERAVDSLQEEIAERIYNQTKSRISSELARAYIEGNKEAIEKLEAQMNTLNQKYKRLLQKQKAAIEEVIDEIGKKIEETSKLNDTKAIKKNLDAIDALIKSIDKMKLAQFPDLKEKFDSLLNSLESLGDKAKEIVTQQKLEEIRAQIESLKGSFGKFDLSALQKLKEELNSIDTSNLSDETKKLAEDLKKIIDEFITAASDIENVKQSLASHVQLFKHYMNLGDLEDASKHLRSIIDILQSEYEKAVLGQETIYGSGTKAISKLETELENYKKKLEEITKLQEKVVKDSLKGKVERLKILIKFFYDEKDFDVAKKYAKELTTIYQNELAKAAAGEKTIFGTGKAAIPAIKSAIKEEQNFIKQLDELQKQADEAAVKAQQEKIRRQIESLKVQIEQTPQLEIQKELVEQIIEKYKQLGDNQSLEEYREKLREINKQLETLKEARNLDKLFEHFSGKGNLDEAKRYLEQLISLYEQERDKTILGETSPLGDLNEIESKLNKLYEKHRQITAEIKRQNEELEKQKGHLQTKADLLNGFIGQLASSLRELGGAWEAVAAVVSQIRFEVEKMSDGTYKLTSNLEDVEALADDIGSALAMWGLNEIINQVKKLISLWQKLDEDLKKNKWEEKERSDIAELFKNFNEFEENQKKLEALRNQKTAAVVGGGTVGGLVGAGIGFLLGGPWGALLGGAIGAGGGMLAAEQATKDLDKQIDELDEKLQATFEKIKEALGTTIEDVSGALSDAFNAATYEDFVDGFTNSLYHMTRQALIKAFLASEAVQPLLKDLSDYISKAVMDGIITAEEKATIKSKAQKVATNMKEFYKMLNDMFPEEGSNWGTSSTIRETITEETGNRLAALFATMNLHVADIKDMLKSVFTGNAFKVLVTNTSENPVEVEIARGKA